MSKATLKGLKTSKYLKIAVLWFYEASASTKMFISDTYVI